MFLSNVAVIVSLLLPLIPVQQGQQQQCSVDRLPVFGDTDDRNAPNSGGFQAIVPAYTFNCSGRVTEWRTCVQPGGSGDEEYYIQFQVWRSTGNAGIEGCYDLVGYNTPLDDEDPEEFLSPQRGMPPDRCVVLPVRESQQIEFQPGDVIGYYVDRQDRNNGGIQWIEENDDVVVYYRDDVPRDDIKSQYAISMSDIDSSACGFENDDSYSLSVTSPSAPIISLSVATLTPGLSSSPLSSPPGIAVVSTTATAPSATPPPPTVPTPGSTTTSPSTSTPPSTTGDNPRTFIIVGVVLVIFILALVIAVSVIIIFVLVKRSRNEKPTTATTANMDNPSYQVLTLKPTVTTESNVQTSADPPNYDYCRVDGESRTHKQPQETMYATVANGEKHNYHSIENEGVGQYDYTAIYDDPTSPSYVSEVYSSGSVFDAIGTYVPTLGERSNYTFSESPVDSHKYNNLQFFERDQVFWAPASTESGLYEQLCTKRYREINRNQIRLQEELGSGQFGTVSKGVWMYQNESMEVAVKTLAETATEMNRVKFLQEAAIMGQFYHPNIVRLHGVVTVGDPVLIVLDFMCNGDMKRYLDYLVVRSEDQVRLPSQFLKYGREIAAGMAYLAKKSFVHRDLAARNILLDDRMSCKIGDFGMARDLVDDTYYTSHGGQIPVKWTAPEALLYKKFSTTSDVWSYAMVLYEIWSVGKKPFQNLSNRDVVQRLQNPQCLAPPPGCPRQVYTLMVDCWNPEPQLRPTFETVFRTLRRPEELLLHWSEEDVAAGRHLLRATHTTHSFSDLQNKYTAQ